MRWKIRKAACGFDEATRKLFWQEGQTKAFTVDGKRESIVLTYYASGVSEDVYNKTRQFLTEQRLPTLDAKLWPAPPAWLEKDCSVIYYDEANRSVATELAERFEKVGFGKFRIVKGSIFREIVGQESRRIFVHHVPCSG